MQKKSENKPDEKEIKEIPKEKPEIGEESSWSKDQQEREYYYDDASGYEKYEPDEDEKKDKKSIGDS